MSAGPGSGPRLLEALRQNRPVLVLGIRTSRTGDVVRMAASSGHDAVMIDLEHSAMSINTCGSLCATAADLGLTAFVRIPEDDYGVVGRVLDAGADGIIAPRVETVEQARRLADACRFPPLGHRSQLTQLPRYGMVPMSSADLGPRANAETIVKVLIESPAGVRNADAIAAVDGIDIIGIGANDLTSELGVPGRYDDPAVADAVTQVARAAQAHAKVGMIGGVGDRDRLRTYLAAGLAPFLITGMDTDLLYAGIAARAQQWRDWHGAPRPDQE